MAYTQRIAGFVPEIFSKNLLKNFDEKFVFGKLINREYEGEIKKFGDTVHMRSIGTPTVSAYDNTATPPITYQTTAQAGGSDDTLTIDQRDYWAVKVEDIEQVQSDIMNQRSKYTERAAVALNDATETYLFQSYMPINTATTAVSAPRTGMLYVSGTSATAYNASTDYAIGSIVRPSTANGYVYMKTTDANAGGATEPTWTTAATGTLNKLGSTYTDGDGDSFTLIGFDKTAAISASNLYANMVAYKKAFRAANTWTENQMWIVVPPEIEELILTSTELVHATDRADKLIEQGLLGSLAGFKVYVSNNLLGAGSAASPWKMFAGNMDAVCFADQIMNTRAVELEDEFATGISGLHVYGVKIPAPYKYGIMEIRAGA